MEELIKALTRAVNAFAEHYESVGAEPKKAKKSQGLKTRIMPEPAAQIVEMTPQEDLAVAEKDAVEKPAPTKEEILQATKDVTDIAKMLVAKFSRPALPDNKPEGFHMAKKLLAEFKVERLIDLTHDQRLEFIRKVRKMLLQETSEV